MAEPDIEELVTSEEYAAVMRKNDGRTFWLELSALDVGILHGALRLMLTHPAVRVLSDPFRDMAGRLRAWCVKKYLDMGFSQEQADYLDAEFK
jgi:hypothetical protein